MSHTPFHLAIPVHDLAAARRFYGELLGCAEGRSDERWIDFNLYGHQLVCHMVEAEEAPRKPKAQQQVDHHHVPVPHFGVVLPMASWEALRDKLTHAGLEFVVEPHIRFKGQNGEQATMFFYDPSGNAIEFKAFADLNQLFAR